MMKLNITLDQTNWLEATWVEEIVIQVPVEKETEVDGGIVKETILEDKVETTQVHCESFSGHPEHIAMLRAKALEFETELTDFEDLITSCQDKFEMPSEESIQAEITKNLVAEANNYLSSTDWVNSYKLRHDLGLEIIPEDSSKWEVIWQRKTYIEFLRANQI